MVCSGALWCIGGRDGIDGLTAAQGQASQKKNEVDFMFVASDCKMLLLIAQAIDVY